MTTAYCDYTYYTGTYLGNQIASGDFARLALRASAVIDQLTFGRAAIQTDPDIVDEIKMATCAVAEEYQAIEQDGSVDGIASESVGSVSVSYTESSSKRLTKDDRLAAAAKTYLGSSGLMFSGFADGEYATDTIDDDAD